jgi:hypothetical protein
MSFPFPKHPRSCHAKTVLPTCTNCRQSLKAVAVKDTPVSAARRCSRCGAGYQVTVSWAPMPTIKFMVVRTEILETSAPTSSPVPK